MFKNSYQSGLLSIFYSCGSNPLSIWDSEVQNGHIKRLTDQEVNSVVLEIVSTNVATTFISCPKNNQVLGIRLPFLVMIVKNLKRYFSFEITIMDDKNMRRRFRISNFQSTTKIRPFCTTMPIGLSGGWNQIQFNLADFTRRAYGSQFIESLRVQVHANVRLRRIYFADRLYTEEELPQEYKLYLPLERKIKKKEEKKGAPAEGAAPVEVAPPAGETATEALLPPTAVPSKAASLEKKKSIVAEAAPLAAEAAPAEEAVAEVKAEEAAGGATPAESEAHEGVTPAEGEAPDKEALATEGELPVEVGAVPTEEGAAEVAPEGETPGKAKPAAEPAPEEPPAEAAVAE